MENNIFRKKLIDQLSAPEDLSSYVKVLSPSTWTICLAGIIFVVATACWCIFGVIKTKVGCLVYVENGINYAYISSANKDSVKPGMIANIGDYSYVIEEVYSEPSIVEDKEAMYQFKKYGINTTELGYEVKLRNLEYTTLKDGAYMGEIEIDSVSPIKFLIN